MQPDPAHRVEAQRHVVIAATAGRILLAAGEPLGGDPREIAGRVLDPDHVRQPRDFGQRLDRYVGDGPRRHVVDDDRQVRASATAREMGGDAGLARPVVIRHDDQRGVGAGLLGGIASARSTLRVDVSCRSRRSPAPGRAPPRPRVRSTRRCSSASERRHFAGRAARNQPAAALGDLPVDELAKCVLIDTAARKRRHQCGYRPEKHELFPSPRVRRSNKMGNVRSATDKDRGRMMSSMRRSLSSLRFCWSRRPPRRSAQTRSATAAAGCLRRPSLNAVTAMRSATGGGCARATATLRRLMPASSSTIPAGRAKARCAAAPSRRCAPARTPATVIAFFRTKQADDRQWLCPACRRLCRDRPARPRRSPRRAKPGRRPTCRR